MELMITVAISSILLLVAIPAYRDMVLNNCLTTKTNALVSAVQLARSSAITLRDDVSLAALTCSMDADDDDAADGTCASDDEFGEGVVVFRDLDDDGLADPALTEDSNGDGILSAGEDLNGNGRLDVELIKVVRFGCNATLDEIADVTEIIYSPQGSSSVNARFEVCDARDSSKYDGREVSLSFTGRPSTDSYFQGCP